MVYDQVDSRLKACGDEAQAATLMRFFKTGKGEYGEGDRFLGVRVPVTRSVVREFRSEATIVDVEALTASVWHEVRLAGLLLLIEIYKRAHKCRDEQTKRSVVDYYLSILDRGNNWDLVDLVAPKILGEWLVEQADERGVLRQLAAMDGRLWHKRVAVVATWSLIRSGSYDEALDLSERLLSHPHDLIHKATGWMLRETGKRGGMDRLLEFLDRYAAVMPRTMLRYAIEQLSPDLRGAYMKKTRQK